MKTVYFVRHGETEGNRAQAWQKFDTSLSDTGREQANTLAERLAKIPFDALIASTMERAQETARIIGARTEHRVVAEALFHEILRPTAVRGKTRDDPEAAKIMDIVESNWRERGYKHSDEENFYDLKDRAVKALAYLASRPENTIVVVTHAGVLKMIIAAMIRGESVDPDFFEEIDTFLHANNTGITWCEYRDDSARGNWRLNTWNDHAHLG